MSLRPGSLEIRGAHAFGAIGHEVFLAAFQGRARTRDVVEMRAALDRAIALAPKRRVVVVVLIAHDSTLGPRGRDAIAEMMKGAAGSCDAWSVVMSGTGFWAATARGMAAMTLSFVPSGYPVNVCGSAAEAERWLEKVLARPAPMGLASDLETLRSAILPPGASEPPPPDAFRATRGQPSEAPGKPCVTLPVEGHLTRAALDAGLEAVDARLAKEAPVNLLVDARKMVGYDSDARALFVEWNRSRKGKVSKVAFVTDSARWQMVVHTMAVVSGQVMEPFSSMSTADTWLAEATPLKATPPPR